jgi:two-component system response regulator AtoC
VNIPPLRERKEDIPVLASHFLAAFAKEYNKTVEGFSAEAEHLMVSYSWPGNVRELKNVVRGIVVLQNVRMIIPEHLPLEMSGLVMRQTKGRQNRFILPETGLSLDEIERDLIIQAMERAAGNKTKAAKLLGISYDSFRYQLKKFGLE